MASCTDWEKGSTVDEARKVDSDQEVEEGPVKQNASEYENLDIYEKESLVSEEEFKQSVSEDMEVLDDADTSDWTVADEDPPDKILAKEKEVCLVNDAGEAFDKVDSAA